MTLVLDKRSQLQGQPGLHALIVGVSAYPNLPKGNEPLRPEHMELRQLSSTALTAYKIYRWLVDHQQNLPAPLATCRLLLSPSPAEMAVEPQLNGLADRGALNNFLVEAKHWRDDASSHRKNVTFFYFAGHGVERNKGDAVLLLEDFADGIGGVLRNAVDTNNIFNGMASAETRPNMAQTQLYFVDACRDFLPAFKKIERPETTEVFSPELTGMDTRQAPIFYAAAPGVKAQAVPGDQTLFSKALLDCLNGDAGDFTEVEGRERWRVSVHSLNKALAAKMDDWNKTLGAQQDFILSGLVADAVIHFLDSPPLVEIMLQVDPSEALQSTKVEVLDERNNLLPEVPTPLQPHPYCCKWPAGFYTIRATIDPPDPRWVNFPGKSRPIMPPRVNKTVRVIP